MLHRDPRNFCFPDAFWPERWLLAAPGGAGAPPDFRHDEGAFIPFSHGPMNCVGRALALQEIRTVVCAVLRRFRLRPAEGWSLADYVAEYRDYFVTTRGKVPVFLEVRKM